MREARLTVEIHALQPRWIEHERPKYRLYIDDDLITERTWIWDQNTYVEETLDIAVSEGVSHTVRIEIIKFHPMHIAQFGLQNIKINGWERSDHGGHRSELSFILA